MTNPDYNGCDMTREIARFFADLAVYNSSIGRYDINSRILTMKFTNQKGKIESILGKRCQVVNKKGFESII